MPAATAAADPPEEPLRFERFKALRKMSEERDGAMIVASRSKYTKMQLWGTMRTVYGVRFETSVLRPQNRGSR